MKNSNIKFIILSLIALHFYSCAPKSIQEPLPAINETGDEGTSPVDGTAANRKQNLQLDSNINVRYLKNNILELAVELPSGTKIEIQDNYQTVNYDYRNSAGEIIRSSTGFISTVKIIEVPKSEQAQFTPEKIKKYNSVSGGLYILASTLGAADTSIGKYAVIVPHTAGLGFLKFYKDSGQPRSGFSRTILKRFPNLNRGIASVTQPIDQQKKWSAIYGELKAAVDRTVITKKSYMIMDKKLAIAASIDFEKTGRSLKSGAWTIATQATAVRHGFENVPCAETQSEILRQAYMRAGYKVTDDFNTKNQNVLIWSNTAAVQNFSSALYKAGFIAWDATKYKPMTGSFLMHGAGQSPGHTYVSAGDNGRIILDNGAPQGRDLRNTSQASVEMQYQIGLFFLPPGINPEMW